MPRSHGRATAQNLSEFVQNLKKYICKPKIYAFLTLFSLFLHNLHILCDLRCYFFIFSCAKFQNWSFDGAKKSTFRMSGDRFHEMARQDPFELNLKPVATRFWNCSVLQLTTVEEYNIRQCYKTPKSLPRLIQPPILLLLPCHFQNCVSFLSSPSPSGAGKF